MGHCTYYGGHGLTGKPLDGYHRVFGGFWYGINTNLHRNKHHYACPPVYCHPEKLVVADIWDIILTTSAVVAAIGAAIGIIWKLTALIRRLESVLATDKNGDTAIARTADAIQKIDSRVGRIEYQLYPNGGGSLSDKVHDIDKQIAEIGGMLTILVEKDK